jgi:predicted lysophospholipase L1 biosynthesis ABC-type transport system permease subunit
VNSVYSLVFLLQIIAVIVGCIVGFVIQWAFVINLPEKRFNALSPRRRFGMMMMGAVAAFVVGVATMTITYDKALEVATIAILRNQSVVAVGAMVFIRRVLKMLESLDIEQKLKEE